MFQPPAENKRTDTYQKLARLHQDCKAISCTYAATRTSHLEFAIESLITTPTTVSQRLSAPRRPEYQMWVDSLMHDTWSPNRKQVDRRVDQIWDCLPKMNPQKLLASLCKAGKLSRCLVATILYWYTVLYSEMDEDQLFSCPHLCSSKSFSMDTLSLEAWKCSVVATCQTQQLSTPKVFNRQKDVLELRFSYYQRKDSQLNARSR